MAKLVMFRGRKNIVVVTCRNKSRF